MCDSRVIGLINALIFLFSPLTVLLIYRPLTVVQFLPSSWQFLHKLYYPSVSLQYVLSRTLRHSPILSRTLPFIIHSCVQSSPNASSCFSPYFIFFFSPFSSHLSSSHLSLLPGIWRVSDGLLIQFMIPPPLPPQKRKTKQNKAKQTKTNKNSKNQFWHSW